MGRIKEGNASDASNLKRSTHYGKLFGMCILTVIIACLLPMYLLYLNNLSEMTFLSILKPVGISVLCGIAVFIALQYLFHKSITFSSLFSACFMLILLNFGALYKSIKKIIPSVYSLVLSIIVLVVCLVLLWLLLKDLQRKSILRKLVAITLITLIGLFLINTATVGSKLVARIDASISATPPPAAATLPEKRGVSLSSVKIPEEASLQDYMPNIYYFVLDEYAAIDIADRYYGYDNSPFIDSLMDSGFNVSLTSRSLSTATQICMADVVTLNYLSNENRNLPYARKALKDALLYDELRGLGYSIYQMSTGPYVFKGIASLRDESEFILGEPETEDGTTVAEIARDQSILSAFNGILGASSNDGKGYVAEETELLPSNEIIALARHGYAGTIKNRLSVFDYFDNASVYSEADKVVIFSYICSPHVPFIFQANGAPAAEGHRADWHNTKYYLDQYRYVTARMERIIQAIISENPNCIIIVQSDHGVRWHDDCSQPHPFEITPEDEKHILNAVYCCGRTLDIEGLTATNTMRLILTQYGLDYPPLREENLLAD